MKNFKLLSLSLLLVAFSVSVSAATCDAQKNSVKTELVQQFFTPVAPEVILFTSVKAQANDFIVTKTPQTPTDNLFNYKDVDKWNYCYKDLSNFYFKNQPFFSLKNSIKREGLFYKITNVPTPPNPDHRYSSNCNTRNNTNSLLRLC